MQSADIQNTFREAVNNATPQSDYSYKNTLETITQSTYGWALLTWIIVFMFLYLTNPPFVQKSDNDMEKPTPNIITITVISTVCAIVLIVLTKWNVGFTKKF